LGGSDAPSLSKVGGGTIIRYRDQAVARRADPIVRLMEHAQFAPVRETRLGDVLAALGLVAAEAGVCVVPATVRRMRSDDVHYLPLDGYGPGRLGKRCADHACRSALKPGRGRKTAIPACADGAPR
jgi:hypothetical protein